ncbi:MAG: hypothetical protein ACWA6X_01480 [Bauldia sp.]
MKTATAQAPFADGVLTFLLTDIAGSVRQWEAAPARMRQLLRRHDAVLRQEVTLQAGHIFRTAGDSFHAAFALPASALEAAVAAQRALAGEDFSALGSLRVRMAIHVGPAESRDGDYYGQGINQTARILELTHGGQVLVSGTAARLIGNELPNGARLIDLGHHHLRDFAAAERLFQIHADDLPSQFPAIKSSGRSPTNVVRGTTSFIGRTKEMADIGRALDHARLVTLLGNGGAGKTRISIEAAQGLMPRFPDGIWFVDFSALSDPNLVADKVAAVVGAVSSAEQAGAESVARTLRDQTALLIFDNCEHLLAATAELADYVLKLCPNVAVLATSRQALALPSEHILPISNLNVARGDDLDREAALASPAIRLFVDRAESASSFNLTDANVKWVADICSQLDGIPLALELAAPQLRTNRPEALSALLRDSISVPSKLRTTPDRHRTLASTFDWSYRLLAPTEQLLLQRLGVLAAGCSMAGAIAVCGWGELTGDDVRRLLPDLLDKSLVVADLNGPETRFRLLETTRRYALKRLSEGGQEQETRRRLLAFLTTTLSEATANWAHQATQSWKDQYGPELDNTRATLEWAFGALGDLQPAVELVSVTLRLWDEYGLLPERQKWFDRGLREASSSLPAGVMARLYIGNCSLKGAADPRAFGMARNAVDLLRQGPASLDFGEALARAGASLLMPNNIVAAQPYLIEARDVLQRFGPTKQLSSCLRSLCAMRSFEADFDAARRYAMESESISRKIGDAIGVETNRINLAEIDFASGNREMAIARAKQVLRQATAGPRLLALCECNLSGYLICTDDLVAAEISAIKALRESRALLWGGQIAIALGNLALIRALGGDSEIGAQLLGYVETRVPDWHESREPIERVMLDRLIDRLSSTLDPHDLALHREIGAGFSEDEACELAAGPLSPDNGMRPPSATSADPRSTDTRERTSGSRQAPSQH